MLMEEPDIDKFELMLIKTVQQLQLDSSTVEMAQYFATNYVSRKREWAHCYRRRSMINTNMYLDAFHRVLKHIYLEGKVNRRVDTCVHTLLKISRDKSFERLIKLSKGKNSNKHDNIRKRHKTSLEMTTKNAREIKKGSWTVLSKDEKTEYTVTKLNLECNGTCFLKCIE